MTPEDQAAFDSLMADHAKDPFYFYDIRYVCDSLVKWNVIRRSQLNLGGGVVAGCGSTFAEAVASALEFSSKGADS